jgi:hypothetical protein
MSNVLEIKAAANGRWNKNINTGVTSKNTIYPRCVNLYDGTQYLHGIGFIFFDNLNLSDTDEISMYVSIDAVDYYTKPLKFGYYNSKQTIDTVTYDSSKTQFHVITSPSEMSYEFDLDYRAANNGLCFWVDQSANASDSCAVEIDNISRDTYPKLLLTIDDATVSNIAVNQTDTDINIIASWDSTNQKFFEFEAVQGGSVIYNTSGTTVDSVTIPYNTLNGASTIFRVRVGNGIVGDVFWSDWEEYSETLIKKTPIISILEPNSINKLLSQSILVEFTGSNISSWKYETIQGGVVKYTDQGTTARETTIPPNVLSTGAVTSRLTATYIPVWATNSSQYRTSIKEVTFTAYGPPPNPTLNLDTIYSTAYPLFEWTASSEQMTWQIKLLDGSTTVFDTGETSGSAARQYQHDEPLENNKVYQAQLRIKNQYNLYSAWVSKNFEVSYAELAQPTFNIYGNQLEACIVLNVYNDDSEDFYKAQIYRRELGTDTWLQIADDIAQNDEYKDFECASGITYEYKVRAISVELTYTDSDTKTMSVIFKYPRLSIAGTNDFMIFDGNFSATASYDDGKSYQLYAGLSKPKESRSLTDYRVIDVQVDVKYSDLNNLMRIINTQSTLFLRDSKGLAAYGSAAIKSKKDNVLFSRCSIGLTFTETYYGGVQDVIQPESNEFSIKEW